MIKNIFNAYSLGDRQFVDFIVDTKIRTNRDGHITYSLKGIAPSGKKVGAVVNEQQWNQFDVPIIDNVASKIDRVKKRQQLFKNPKKKKKQIKNKNRKQVYNQQIQKWLAQHYSLDLNNLTGEENEFGLYDE